MLDRRRFIKKGTISSIGVLFNSHLFSADILPSLSENQILFSEIKLKSNVAPEKLIAFYHELIGLEICTATETGCSFRAGESILNFTCDPLDDTAPFYHFAFNIPEQKIRQAEQWQLKRTELIEPPDHLKDQDNFSKNIVFFRHWNAHSIFFFDPAGNVVEYIARHSNPDPKEGDFSAEDILCISEIGLIVDDVEEMFQKISNHTGIKKYNTSSNQFLAMGNEQGLILLMKKNTRAVFRKGRKRDIFDTEIYLNSKIPTQVLDFEDYPYLVYSV